MSKTFISRSSHLAQIKEADEAYYNADAPIMSDIEYDALRREYIEKYGSQDLDYVPGGSKKGLRSFKHQIPVTSLAKVQAKDTRLIKEKISKLFPIVIQPKLDGLTIVVYGNKAVTRGVHGITGEVVNNFMSRYPLYKNQSSYPVRGEVVLAKDMFEEINKDRVAQGLEPYVNPRNAAAGIIRSIDKSPYLDKLLFLAYDLIDSKMNVTEQLAYIREKTPFDVVETVIPSSVDEAMSIIPNQFAVWNSEDVPVDGVVVKSNKPNSLEVFGATKHHPLNAFAWKSEQETVETILRSVDWQVGRSQITAVAKFDPVEIDGTTVSQASVSNIGIINRLGLSIGAKILVNKANQIIPQVVKVLTVTDEKVVAPNTCPCCNEVLTNVNDVLHCENPHCEERLVQNIDYLASKGVLNIRGLSEETVRKMIAGGLVKDIYDVFDLTVEQILSLDGFKEKSANNLFEAIQSSRENVALSTFFSACCVPNIGNTIGEILMKHYSSYDEFVDAYNEGENFTRLEGVGETTQTILYSQEFADRFQALRRYISPLAYKPMESVGDKSYTIVISGECSVPRREIKKLIESVGAKVVGSVSKNTDFILSDSNATSSKAVKARELGVRFVSEDELRDILGI